MACAADSADSADSARPGGLAVARIGKAHGIRGEVTVALHTDNPQERFTRGARFGLEPGSAGASAAVSAGGSSGASAPAPPDASVPESLTISAARLHNGTWLLSFAEVADRNTAESLRGRWLVLSPAEARDEPDADDAWYEGELVGLRVHDPSGRELGTVSALHARPAQDLLEIRLTDGRKVPVPFVTALVPTVDVPGGLVVVDPPGGLFDLAE